MDEKENRYVTIKTHINGAPHESDFEVKAATIQLQVQPCSNLVIVKVLYVSVDAGQISRMKSCSSSHDSVSAAARIFPGQWIEAYGLGRVVVSASPEFEKDDLVAGLFHWAEYSIIDSEEGMIKKLDPMGFPLSYHAGVLGLCGLTAYAGFFNVSRPLKGEKVFVSAACGSIGNLVGQYAKLHGCYVVGSAGSKEKVALLKEKLGFDDAFNYKEEADLKSALKRYFPDGIDICFENVGGRMTEAAVANMNNYGRVVICGLIAEYTDDSQRAAPDMLQVVYKRIRIQGFLSLDNWNQPSDFMSLTSNYLRDGKMHALETISNGLESIPSAFSGLFRGSNVGKTLAKVAEE